MASDRIEAIQALLEHANRPSAGIVASTIGILMLLLGASGVFGELQDSLNTIWDVQPRPGRGIRGIVRDRFLSFGMVLCVGFLLLASLVLSTVLSASGQYLERLVPGLVAPVRVANLVLGFAVVTVLFALMFKFLPDVTLTWKQVWVGGFVTSALFVLGKSLIGRYLGASAIASFYGAAGSLAVVLVWVYYNAILVLIGAELTRAYAAWLGERVEPATFAVPEGAV